MKTIPSILLSFALSAFFAALPAQKPEAKPNKAADTFALTEKDMALLEDATNQQRLAALDMQDAQLRMSRAELAVNRGAILLTACKLKILNAHGKSDDDWEVAYVQPKPELPGAWMGRKREKPDTTPASPKSQ